MTTLVTAAPAELQAVQQRSRRHCITFPDHPLPPGATPSTARIGVESTTSTCTLLVDRGIRYAGNDHEVSHWLEEGSLEFASFLELISWLRDRLDDSSEAPVNRPAIPASVSGPPTRPDPRQPQEVTALELVRVPDHATTQIDEPAILERLSAQVVGQPESLATIAAGVAAHYRKSHPRRPVSFLLLGPTGVGKTLTATALAAAIKEDSRDEVGVLRLDMSEFSERHSVSRLVGAPPGYLGYGDDSLASRLADNPRTIVLFDEIDKAHPAVLTTLMNLMDAGRLDSGRHGEVTAQSAVLIFTSNLGAAALPHGLAAEQADVRGRQHLLSNGVPPELVGRFGHVCIFDPMNAVALAAVSAAAVCVVAADYGLTVDNIDPEFLSGLLEAQASGRIGVRGLEYLVERELGNEFAAARSQFSAVRVTAGSGPRVIGATESVGLEKSAGPDPVGRVTPRGSNE